MICRKGDASAIACEDGAKSRQSCGGCSACDTIVLQDFFLFMGRGGKVLYVPLALLLFFPFQEIGSLVLVLYGHRLSSDIVRAP